MAGSLNTASRYEDQGGGFIYHVSNFYLIDQYINAPIIESKLGVQTNLKINSHLPVGIQVGSRNLQSDQVLRLLVKFL